MGEIVTSLQRDLDPSVDEDMVMVTLDDLTAAQLLEQPIECRSDEIKSSPRRFVQKMAVLGGLIPVVESMVAPTPAQAQSGIPTF